jgi:hypothetical protein
MLSSFVDLPMVSHVPLFLALTTQLEARQLATGDASSALNAQGETLEACLQDVPVCTREVVLHGIYRSATIALAIA